MAKLTAAQRKRLPRAKFAGPRKGMLPVNDKNHAKAALTYGIPKLLKSGKITPAQAATARAKAKRVLGTKKKSVGSSSKSPRKSGTR